MPPPPDVGPSRRNNLGGLELATDLTYIVATVASPTTLDTNTNNSSARLIASGKSAAIHKDLFVNWRENLLKTISSELVYHLTHIMIKLFDSHCHLQDPRIFNVAPKLIREAIDTGVIHFAVNGVSEKDWHLVKEMSDSYPCVVPNFGLHPWFISDRTGNWLNTLKKFLEATPSAAVGEIGLDKGSIGRQIDFTAQVEIFREQLQLAKKLKRPASVHCVRAFGDLLEIMKSTGPFPAGVVLHSYMGSAEMVPELSRLGAYFSFSGFLMSMKERKAKKMLKSIPPEKILLETDAPDALPKASKSDSLILIERKVSVAEELLDCGENSPSNNDNAADNTCHDESGASELPEVNLNHPANIHHVLAYTANLLEMSKEQLADVTYRNAVRLFSYEGSKLLQEA
ncbi:TatD related DNase [Forsythia ovata]|uniref:TatD related DNase n=1 Tax=Forsythia ovata TaxID=205694 RepID=A0ABD1S336_9LAMI